MSTTLTTFAIRGSLDSLQNINLQRAPTVALTIGYRKRNQKKIRRMRRQGLKV